MALKGAKRIDDLVVGHVGEWDLLSGDLIEHKVHDRRVFCMALSGNMFVIGDGVVVRVFHLSTCLLVLPKCDHHAELCFS